MHTGLGVKPLPVVNKKVERADCGFRATISSRLGKFSRTFATEVAAECWAHERSIREVKLIKACADNKKREVAACTS